MTEAFDYIVVGGGTAGRVIAARLSEHPGIRVLLLEAGAADPLPAMSDPAAWWTLWGTSVDWAYQTVPSPAPATLCTADRGARCWAGPAGSTR